MWLISKYALTWFGLVCINAFPLQPCFGDYTHQLTVTTPIFDCELSITMLASCLHTACKKMQAVVKQNYLSEEGVAPPR